LEDSELERTLFFFRTVSNTWQYVETDVVQKIERFVLELPTELFEEVEYLVSFKPLQEHAKLRISRANYLDLTDSLFFIPPSEVVEQTIKFYLKAKNFGEANELGKRLSMYASELDKSQIQRIVSKAAENEQIRYSNELGPLLAELRTQKTIKESEFDDLLKLNKLSKFAPTTPQTTRK